MDETQNKMKLQPNQYTKIRFSKIYLLFLIFQCLLGFVILIISIFNYTHMKNAVAISLEYLLSIFVILDVYIKFKSQPLFFKNKESLFDIIIFAIFLILLLILSFVRIDANANFLINLQTNLMMFLTIIIGRYLTQLIRLIFYLRGNRNSLITEDSKLKQIELIEKNNSGLRQTDLENNLKQKQIVQTPVFQEKFKELKDFSRGSNPLQQEQKHQVLHQEF